MQNKITTIAYIIIGFFIVSFLIIFFCTTDLNSNVDVKKNIEKNTNYNIEVLKNISVDNYKFILYKNKHNSLGVAHYKKFGLSRNRGFYEGGAIPNNNSSKSTQDYNFLIVQNGENPSNVIILLFGENISKEKKYAKVSTANITYTEDISYSKQYVKAFKLQDYRDTPIEVEFIYKDK